MRNIVFIGNCQAWMVFNVYRLHIAPKRAETVDYVPAYEDADAAAMERINSADLIVFQVTDVVQKVPMPTGIRVVLFPHVTAFFLWPFFEGKHPCDADIPAQYRRPFTHAYGDKWLDREISRGADPSSLAARYRDLDVVKVTNLDRRIELCVAAQRARDVRADTRFGDCITDRLTSEYVFTHPHHPSAALCRIMAREVFSRMDCGTQEIEAALLTCRHTLFPYWQIPVHPGIADHLRLAWASPDRKYSFAFGERVTWSEYCDRYVAHDWGRELQDCLARAQQSEDLSRADLTSLAAEMETAASRYASADGLFALSKIRARLGDVDGAIEAATSALGSAPYAWYYQTHLALLLSEAGRLDEALTVAEDVVEWMLHLPDPHITLAIVQKRRGCREAMRRAARAALAIAPDNARARRVLADAEMA
jgi:Polysaccharide biosynthesis enzyme WcbI